MSTTFGAHNAQGKAARMYARYVQGIGIMQKGK